MCKFKGFTKPEGEVKARLRRLFSRGRPSDPEGVRSPPLAGGRVCALGFQQLVGFSLLLIYVSCVGGCLLGLGCRAEPTLQGNCPKVEASPGLALWRNTQWWLSGPRLVLFPVSTAEHACYDPKDSELCLARAKPQETGVEARSRCDVQIHGISWA